MQMTRVHRRSLMLVGLLGGLMLSGAENPHRAPHWNDYTILKKDTPAPTVVNGSFERKAEGWQLCSEARIVPRAGTNGTIGLAIERTNPKAYNLSGQTILGLIPGCRYNFRVMARSKGIKGHKYGGTFCVEHSDKDDNFISMGGSYTTGLFGDNDWKELQIRGHVVPRNAASTRISFYLGPKATGQVVFDDLVVTPADAPWCIYLTNASQRMAIAGQALICRIIPNDCSAIPSGAQVNASFLGASVTTGITDGCALIPTTSWPLGKGTMILRVFDRERKVIYAEQQLPLTLGRAYPKVAFDSKGRTLLKGKRFLPIGMYCNIHNRQEVNGMHEAGFNTVMPYNSAHMGIVTGRSYKGIQEALDYCEQKDMHVIFSFAGVYSWGSGWVTKQGLYGNFDPDTIVTETVSRIKDHPALFGYYIADEVSQAYLTDLTARRCLLNDIDPNHPVWQVHCLGYNTSEFEPYGPSCDVIGLDYYPFSYPEKSTLGDMEQKLLLARRSRLPQWFVPQCFNWRRFNSKSKKEWNKYAFPNRDEYRSQLLLAAGCGIKAFVMFVYQPLCLTDPELDGDHRQIKETVTDGNRLLRHMEPYILSDVEPEKVPVKNLSGKSSAWLFQRDDGRKCLAVIGLLPGKNIAELSVPTSLKSVWGKTVLEGAVARFETTNIGCDLLE